MIIGRCPRCNGQLTLERDDGQWEANCLQCGYNPPLKNVLANPKRYDVSVPYTESPTVCTCNIYNTIPFFEHGFTEEDVLYANKEERIK